MSNLRHFLSCDWGTTSFRLRLVADLAAPRVVAEVRSAEGARSLASAGAAAYAGVLARHTAELAARHALAPETLPAVVSGMASSSVGWRELPYARLPFALDGSSLSHARLSEAPPVFLISGIAAEDDVMRGEETELMGLLAGPGQPGLPPDCMAVLAGTHAKHVRIENGTVTGFRTYLTGELYDVLSRHSLLASSVGKLDEPATELPLDRFREGVLDSRTGTLAHDLFAVRAGSLLRGRDAAASRALLSGLLIGHELADLARSYPAGPIWLAAPPHQAALYEAALQALGLGERLHLLPSAVVEQSTVRAHARLLRRWLAPAASATAQRSP